MKEKEFNFAGDVCYTRASDQIKRETNTSLIRLSSCAEFSYISLHILRVPNLLARR